jgi:hypothetical protein
MQTKENIQINHKTTSARKNIFHIKLNLKQFQSFNELPEIKYKRVPNSWNSETI